MDSAAFQHLVEEARAYCRQMLEQTKTEFGLGSYQRYELDLEHATIRFLDEKGVEQVKGSIQAAGSWARDAQSWMWSWENDSIPEISRRRMQAVEAFGKREQIPMVQQSFSPCSEAEAWAMTALSGKLLSAEGFYRAPGTSSDLFLLLYSLARV